MHTTNVTLLNYLLFHVGVRCTCLYMHVCLCRVMRVSMHVSPRNARNHTYLLREGSQSCVTDVVSLLDNLHSLCLHLPKHKLQLNHQSTQYLHGFWRSDLWSSSMYGNHFSHWAIFPDPIMLGLGSAYERNLNLFVFLSLAYFA